MYQTYCTPCHGSKGEGDGRASASLNPKPAGHTSAMVQSESDGTIYYKISEGRAHTAKAVLNAAQRWAIVLAWSQKAIASQMLTTLCAFTSSAQLTSGTLQKFLFENANNKPGINIAR